MHIAHRHLIPKQLKEHGLTHDQLQISDDAVKMISEFAVMASFMINLFVTFIVFIFFD